MSLTSTTLLVSAVLCTALMFAATVWLWPRLARRSGRAVLGRIGLILTVQALLLASVGLTANRTFLLYGSWSELLGRKSAPAAHRPGLGRFGREGPRQAAAEGPRQRGTPVER